MGLGIALVGCLVGAPAFAGDKPAKAPVEDGSKVMITSPKDGEEVDDSFELKYELTKGSQATHVHVYVDGQYQKGFAGEVKGLSKGDHKITVKGCHEGPRSCHGHPYHHRRSGIGLGVCPGNPSLRGCRLAKNRRRIPWNMNTLRIFRTENDADCLR